MTDRHDPAGADDASKIARDGLLSAFIAYFFWGTLPVYFILVKHVGSYELLVHRIIWAVPFGAVILYFRRQWPEVADALSEPQTRRNLSATALLITGNWLVYILAVQHEQIFQASLGYYINPLIFALFGVVIYKERLSRPQGIAIVLAAVGVSILATSSGKFPLIAVFLGISFALYGVIRKSTPVGGMPGLFIETILLLPFAAAYLIWLLVAGTAEFYLSGPAVASLLLLAGPLTVIPLLFFAIAAKRLTLTTLGLMQFMVPTLQLLVGYLNGEALTTAHVACFVCIWTAVAVFSWDAWRRGRNKPQIP